MKLEVCVRSEADNPYWVANIITTCGQLLLLRYEGYQEDRRADFWCDIMTADLHPLGWSRQHGKTMRAPEGKAGLVLALLLFQLFEVEIHMDTGNTRTVVWCFSCMFILQNVQRNEKPVWCQILILNKIFSLLVLIYNMIIYVLFFARFHFFFFLPC